MISTPKYWPPWTEEYFELQDKIAGLATEHKAEESVIGKGPSAVVSPKCVERPPTAEQDVAGQTDEN